MKSFLLYSTIFLLAVSAWIQLDFEQYISVNRHEYESFGIEERRSYKPAVLFTLEWLFGSHQELNIIGKKIFHNRELASTPDIRDAYLIECYFSDGLKERILVKGDW